MARVGDELGLAVAGAGQGRGHRVEGARQPGDLVLALDGDPDGEVLGTGDVLDGLGELVYGAQPGTGHPESGRARAHGADAA